MADKNLALAVSAIIISYQGARDFIHSAPFLDDSQDEGQELAAAEGRLLDALETGENQVSSRYAAIYDELGDAFRLADADTHSKLARITQLIDQKITQPLHLAYEPKSRPPNYVRMTQDVEVFRRCALGILEEQRLTAIRQSTTDRLALRYRSPSSSDDRNSEYSNSDGGERTYGPGHNVVTYPTSRHTPVSRARRVDSDRPRSITDPSQLHPLHRAKNQVRRHSLHDSTFRVHGIETHDSSNDTDKDPLGSTRRYMWVDSSDDVVPLPQSTKKRSFSTSSREHRLRNRDQACPPIHRPDSFLVLDTELPRHTQPSVAADAVIPQSSSTRSLLRTRSSRSNSDTDRNAYISITPFTTTGRKDLSVVTSIANKDKPMVQLDCGPPPLPLRSPLRLTRASSCHKHRGHNNSQSSDLVPELPRTPDLRKHDVTIALGQWDPHLLLPFDCEPRSPHPAFKTLSPSVSSPSLRTTCTNTQISSPSMVSLVSALRRPITPKGHLSTNVAVSNDGICKGAFKSRKKISKGFRVHTTLLLKSTNRVPQYQCKHCNFQSAAPNKFPGQTDENVYTAPGVMYRWSFLAKSHVRRKTATARVESGSLSGVVYRYCCLFCTGTPCANVAFEGADALMAHIVAEHGTLAHMSGALHGLNCVFGRLAKTIEDFDICVLAPAKKSMPKLRPVQDLTAPSASNKTMAARVTSATATPTSKQSQPLPKLDAFDSFRRALAGAMGSKYFSRGF